MILVGKLKIGEKLFTMNDSEGTVYLAQLGFPDNFYGGYVNEARKTKFGIYMLVNDRSEIVNLGYTEDSLTEAGAELLGLGVEEVEKVAEEPKVEPKVEKPVPMIKLPEVAKPVVGRGRPPFKK